MRDTLVRLSDERIAILISRLPDSKEELITGHIRLGKFLVSRARRRFGGSADDLLGAAMLTLTRCVERLASGEKVVPDGNIGRWLAHRMWGAIRKEVCDRSVIRICASTIFEHAAKGTPIKLKRQEQNLEMISKDQSTAEVDLLDQARSILKTDLEHRIFDLRYQGLSDVEIGHLLGMSPRSVYRIREDIGKRFLEINDG